MDVSESELLLLILLSALFLLLPEVELWFDDIAEVSSELSMSISSSSSCDVCSSAEDVFFSSDEVSDSELSLSVFVLSVSLPEASTVFSLVTDDSDCSFVLLFFPQAVIKEVTIKAAINKLIILLFFISDLSFLFSMERMYL